MGGGTREGGKWKSLGGGNWEKFRKIGQHFVEFRNRNGTKRWESLWIRGGNWGINSMGSGKFRSLVPPPPPPPPPLPQLHLCASSKIVINLCLNCKVCNSCKEQT